VGRGGVPDGGRVRRTHTGEGELEKTARLEKARGGLGRLEKASGAVDAPTGARASGRWGAFWAARPWRSGRQCSSSKSKANLASQPRGLGDGQSLRMSG
jgi:hypothetical protein